MRTILGLVLVLGFGGLGLGPARAAVEAEEPTVTGIEVARGNGTFLGVALEGLSLVVRYYDEAKEQVQVEADRAAVWWNAPRSGRQRTVMTRDGDGMALRSPGLVRPPHVYIVSLTLLREDGSTIEHHLVDLKDMPES